MSAHNIFQNVSMNDVEQPTINNGEETVWYRINRSTVISKRRYRQTIPLLWWPIFIVGIINETFKSTNKQCYLRWRIAHRTKTRNDNEIKVKCTLYCYLHGQLICRQLEQNIVMPNFSIPDIVAKPVIAPVPNTYVNSTQTNLQPHMLIVIFLSPL